MYHEIILVCFQICAIPLRIYYNKSVISLKQYLSALFLMCIYIPIVEEILFRYALYHLLEKYMDNTFQINLINGLIFGLMHIANIAAIEFRSMLILGIHICSNIYFGYYLAIMHITLVQCMIVHAIYNFIGVTLTFLCCKYTNKPLEKFPLSTDNVYVPRPKLRRCYSLGDYNLFDESIGIDKDKMDKDILQSIENFGEQQKIIRCKFENDKNVIFANTKI